MSAGDSARRLGADAYFAILPEWVLWHPALSPGAVRMFATLQRRANECDHAWPSRKWLADRLGVSKNTADRWLAELVDAGAVSKHRRADPETGEWSSTLYRLRMVGPPPPHVGTRGPTDGATPGPADGATLAPRLVTDTESTDREPFDTEADTSTNEETRREFLDALERRRARKAAP